jgi:V/A-type H+/Na+-transporting ATPase subunit I
MIVPMKKLFLIMPAQGAADAMRQVQGLGVLHVEHMQPPQEKSLALLREELALAEAALDVLRQYEPEHASSAAVPAVHAPPEEWRTQAHHLIDLHKRREQLLAYERQMDALLQQWQPWGDFSPEAVKELSGQGVYVRLYQIPQAQRGQVPPELLVREVFVSAGLVHAVIVGLAPFELPFREVALPKTGLARMREKRAEDARLIAWITGELNRSYSERAGFQAARESLSKQIEFAEALGGMEQQGALAYVRGYVPADTVARIQAEARAQGWGILAQDPGEEDSVPVLLKNPRWVTLIAPLFKLLEVVPGYRELDVSLPFLVFFSIFFGIIIGDAGYGLVYLLLTWWVHKKKGSRAADRTPFHLFYVLSTSAVVWGALTGTFFGQSWVAKLGFHGLVPALNDPKVMQTFCFFIGALHLSIAHGWRAVLKAPALQALAEVGWICVLWSVFFFARMLILSDPLPGFAVPLLYAGMALVVLFTSPQKNVLKGIGAGLGTLALSLMNNFTDVVSYVRLFAVGMAGLAIAETGNTMAAGLGAGWAAVVFGSLIIVIGHALNIVLGPISVLVHGVRLNVLEFSGHASVSWSGSAYRPLKKT